MDAQYVAAYREWVATLSKTEIAKMRKMGLDKPLVDDVADDPNASRAAACIPRCAPQGESQCAKP